jgi:Domain of unknown function (DUF6378)
MSILNDAATILNGNRNADYGDPVMNFKRIANIANLMGAQVTALDCVNVLIALKLSREAHNHKEDNLIDAAAYLEIKNMIIEYENQNIES